MSLVRSIRGVLIVGLLVMFAGGCAFRHETNVLFDCPSPMDSGYVFSVTNVETNEIIPLPHIFTVKSEDFKAIELQESARLDVPPMVTFNGERFVVSTNHPGKIWVKGDQETYTEFKEPMYKGGVFKIDVQKHSRYMYVSTDELMKHKRAMTARRVRQYITGYVGQNAQSSFDEEYVGRTYVDEVMR